MKTASTRDEAVFQSEALAEALDGPIHKLTRATDAEAQGHSSVFAHAFLPNLARGTH